MSLWLKEVLASFDRSIVEILFGEHATKDKDLTLVDVDYLVLTIRVGKVDEEKSTEEKRRICFKNYFAEVGMTYFVIVELYPSFIKVVTVIKKKGKY